MTFGDKVFNYYRELEAPKHLPKEIDVLFPFRDHSVMEMVKSFCDKFYDGKNPRTYLIGINPGRLGAGATGIPFTDPIRLSSELGIANTLDKKSELSSRYIYEMINAYGGANEFYSECYFSSVSPVGFVKDGKNINYYDVRELQEALEEYMVNELKKQISFGAKPVAYSLGMGKNIAYLKTINKKHKLFEAIEALPHPRWIMQYRLKRKEEFINQYLEALKA